jgi:hypothetical protein
MFDKTHKFLGLDQKTIEELKKASSAEFVG